MSKSYIYIVASLHGRSGKTLFARLLADYAILRGSKPSLFDTDTVEKKLTASFPDDAVLIDLAKVTDQMKLFDTLLVPSRSSRIVDLTHRSFSRFFKLLLEMGFVSEAKSRDIETVIFYIPNHETDSYQQGLSLRELFKDCHIIVVENALLGQPGDYVQRSNSYKVLMQKSLNMRLPALDPLFVTVVDDPQLSLSEFDKTAEGEHPPGQRSLAYLSLEARTSIRAWLSEALTEIGRITETVQLRSEMSLKRPF
jgi:hypothetical protein